ncbi:hypothetical protein E2562_024814 [Oryza meyeriana var. granulata]|uniref:Uncharacterized protein n=1 Tax=Oryza meyeriana var. granulata TaxID=110450 RepID=A0A6G1FBP4_9ORYZ|nr:hypothetical protein E2562_024814 [Oryza meyeriana var. granulata]
MTQLTPASAKTARHPVSNRFAQSLGRRPPLSPHLAAHAHGAVPHRPLDPRPLLSSRRLRGHRELYP